VRARFSAVLATQLWDGQVDFIVAGLYMNVCPAVYTCCLWYALSLRAVRFWHPTGLAESDALLVFSRYLPTASVLLLCDVMSAGCQLPGVCRLWRLAGVSRRRNTAYPVLLSAVAQTISAVVLAALLLLSLQAVSCLAFFSSCSLLLSAGGGALLAHFSCPRSHVCCGVDSWCVQAVSCLAFSDSGGLLVSAGEDTLVAAWLLAEVLDEQRDGPSAAAAAAAVGMARVEPLHTW
jgi:hypothetical protein